LSIICSVLQIATDDAASGISFWCLSVWRLPFDLSSKGGPASSYATAGIALRITGVLIPPHHDKVEPPTRRDDNLLLLNYEKTQYVHFTAKGAVLHVAPTGYNNNFISNSTSTKFIGIITETTLSWKAHIDHLLPKLCMACYSARTIKPFTCQENLQSIYYSYFHSFMTYGIIFWGNSTHSIHVLQLQKRVIKIITNSTPRLL
jgi:hypothetical protein